MIELDVYDLLLEAALPLMERESETFKHAPKQWERIARSATKLAFMAYERRYKKPMPKLTATRPAKNGAAKRP